MKNQAVVEMRLTVTPLFKTGLRVAMNGPHLQPRCKYLFTGLQVFIQVYSGIKKWCNRCNCDDLQRVTLCGLQQKQDFKRPIRKTKKVLSVRYWTQKNFLWCFAGHVWNVLPV